MAKFPTKLGRKLIGGVSNALSAPSRARSAIKGSKADSARKAVRLARKTRGVQANPNSVFGRKVIFSRNKVKSLKSKLKKK